MAAAELVAALVIAVVMVFLARRAMTPPPAEVVVPPVSDGSAATSARLALDAIREDLQKGDPPLTLTSVGPDGHAHGLSFPSGGGTVTYGLTASAPGPGLRGLARNAGAVPGVYLRGLAFRLVSPRVLEIDLTASDREGRMSEPRLVVITLANPAKVK